MDGLFHNLTVLISSLSILFLCLDIYAFQLLGSNEPLLSFPFPLTHVEKLYAVPTTMDAVVEKVPGV